MLAIAGAAGWPPPRPALYGGCPATPFRLYRGRLLSNRDPDQGAFDLGDLPVVDGLRGWVVLYRPRPGQFKDLLEQSVFYNLIQEAAHRPTAVVFRGVRHQLERGQCVISVVQFAREFLQTRQSMRTILARLINDERIKINQGHGKAGTIVTICNYDKYQLPYRRPNQGLNQGATKDQPSEQETRERKKETTETPTGSHVAALNGCDLRPSTMISLWNDTAGKAGAREAIRVSENTKEQLRRRLKDTFGGKTDQWRAFCIRISQSDFLTGKCRPGPGRKISFRADLAWVLKPANLEKIFSGKYDGSGPTRLDIDDIM